MALTKDLKADFVGLSVALRAHLPGVAACVHGLADAGLARVPVIAGGLLFTRQPELAASLGARSTAPDAGEAVRCANALFED